MIGRTALALALLYLSLGACGGSGSGVGQPLTVTNQTLSAATLGSAYTTSLSADGGTMPYTWSVSAGTLPPGITLASSGALNGVPSTAGIYTVMVSAVDDSAIHQTASRVFNLIVSGVEPVVQVSLAATPSSFSVGGNFTGLSYEKRLLASKVLSAADSSLMGLFNRLGPSLIRIGGNSVDRAHWNSIGPGQVPGEVAPSDIEGLAGLLMACHWQVLYGLPFLDDAQSPAVLADPNLVAAEAVYAMKSLGDTLYGFEIGNEPDLYHAKIAGYDNSKFEAQWAAYRTAILKAVASAKASGMLPQNATPRFTGPAIAFDQEGYGAPFALEEAQNIILLTRHYYIADGRAATSTLDLLLAPDPKLAVDLAQVASAVAETHIPDGFRLSEANSFYNGGAPGISDSFGSALWAIDFLFVNAWAGSSGVNFHGGGDGPGYTPIADDGSNAVAPRPLYYGLYLFTQAAQGQLIATTTSPQVATLQAYAVAGTNDTRIVLVNTSATDANNVAIELNGSASSATFLSLAGPSLESTTGETLNGTAIAADGSWPVLPAPALPVVNGHIQVPVPPGSALLLIAK